MASPEPRSGRAVLEPAHWLVSAFDTAMILLELVVEITIGPMAHALAEFGPDPLPRVFGRPRVTVVPIRRHPGRRDACDRLGGMEERHGGGHIACFAQADVHQRTRGVDSAMEIAPAALAFDVGFVDIPTSVRPCHAGGDAEPRPGPG